MIIQRLYINLLEFQALINYSRQFQGEIIYNIGMESEPRIARANIPESWADQGKCIWCEKKELHILHPAGMPDQIFCSRCQLGYEIDRASGWVHVVFAPDDLPVECQGTWLPAARIIELSKSRIVVPQQKQLVSIPAAEMTYKGRQAVADSESNTPMQQFKRAESSRRVKLSEEEVAAQVMELYALGNTYQQIRKILFQRYRFSEAALQKAVEPLRQEYEKQKDLAWKKSLVLVAVVLVSLIILGIIYRQLLPLIGAIIQQQLTLFGFSS